MNTAIPTCIALLILMTSQGQNGSISGTLKSSNGEPQKSERVAALLIPGVPEERPDVLVSITQTDEKGHYLLENIPPGRYYIISGSLSVPTYFPGGLKVAPNSVVSVSSGSALTGYDFTFQAASDPPENPNADLFFTVPSLKRFNGRIAMDDGSPVPTVSPMNVIFDSSFGGASGASVENGFLNPLLRDGEYKVFITGFPSGYAVKSVSIGNKDFALGPLQIDSAFQGEILITLFVSNVQGVTVRGRVANVAPEWAIPNRPIRLVSKVPGKPSIWAVLNPDYSFEMSGVPPGEYSISLGNVRETEFPNVTVGTSNISDLTVNLRDNPFPEYPGLASGYGATFDMQKRTTLRGTLTQEIVPLHQPTMHYFRITVTDNNGSVTPWAIMVTSRASGPELMNALNMSLGKSVTVSGTEAYDGTHRLSVDSDTSGNINGLFPPRLASP